MPGGSPPSHGKQSVNTLHPGTLRAIAHGSEVRDQAHKPEHERNCEVGRNREHVPHQRTAEVRPVPHGVRIRKHPVSKPRASHVSEREDTSAGHGKKSHGFGEAVDRVTPGLAEQAQDRRNQRARMANPQPIGMLMPQIPVPLMNRYPSATISMFIIENTMRKPRIHPSETGRLSTMLLIFSPMVEKVWPGAITGTRLSATGICVLVAMPYLCSTYASNSGLGLRISAKYVVRGRVFNSP